MTRDINNPGEFSVVHGDLDKGNADVVATFPAGSVSPHHWHTTAERMVLLSGELHLTYDGHETMILKPGSYAYGPAKLPHTAACSKDAPCVLFIATELPFDQVQVLDLARMDADRDGRVSLAEFQDGLYDFDAIDRDHDQTLSPEEFPAPEGRPITRAEFRAKLARGFKAQDHDGDGYLDAGKLEVTGSGGTPREERIVEAVQQMFSALEADDPVRFGELTTPDFYAFDIGKVMTAGQLIEVVAKAREAGMAFDWQVTEPRVHIDGQTAWITYVNRGSIRKGADTKQMTWLESAVLRKDGDAWRTVFLHSTLASDE